MARQAGYDLAQTCRPRKLAVEQRNELSFGRQPPYPRIGAVIFHKSVEPIPRNMLQQPVKYAILMQHGLILFPVQNVAKRLEHRRINAMHLVHEKRTGQPWACPGHPRPFHRSANGNGASSCARHDHPERTWMAGTKPGHDGEDGKTGRHADWTTPLLSKNVDDRDVGAKQSFVASRP